MANFATLLAAEERARTKMADGTWVNAYAMHRSDGAPVVRFQRPLTATGTTGDGMTKGGAWDETRDDATT